MLDRIWQRIEVKKEWESRRKEVKKEGQTEKIDSGVIKELSIKIRSHMNPLEPKGVHPLLQNKD